MTQQLQPDNDRIIEILAQTQSHLRSSLASLILAGATDETLSNFLELILDVKYIAAEGYSGEPPCMTTKAILRNIQRPPAILIREDVE